MYNKFNASTEATQHYKQKYEEELEKHKRTQKAKEMKTLSGSC